ncbi:ATP-binding protein [Caldicellulosiruptoraceae bacterium PP1]
MADLGKIVSGSYLEGLEIKLDDISLIEDIRIGSILVCDGIKKKYYTMLFDEIIEGMNKTALIEMPRPTNSILLNKIINNSSIYTILKAQPMLAYNKEDRINEPIRNIPLHSTKVRKATPDDISDVFGKSDLTKRFYPIGSPIDMGQEIDVCLDIDRFIERSSGIYGKTGTGKSFIARLIMAGIILSDRTSLLIFDAHSDHGKDSVDEQNRTVKGLRTLFGNKIQLMTIDYNNKYANVIPIEINVEDVEIGDILCVADELNLNETAEQVMIALKNRLEPQGRHWLKELLTNGNSLIDEFGEDRTVFDRRSLEALIRKLEKLKELPYLKYDRQAGNDSIDIILNYLQKGISVDIMFGSQEDLLSYLFVTNVLSRRIFTRYMQQYEIALAKKQNTKDIRPLVIAIEEAHRFLAPEIAKQTIFGTIAREMRKAKVSLMCIDQRPSQIDSEIASQIGTRIILSLSDESDIAAALSGMKNAKQLRGIIESLDTKQQALVIGHAIPMPIAIKTKTYGQELYDYISLYSSNEDIQKVDEVLYNEAQEFFKQFDY